MSFLRTITELFEAGYPKEVAARIASGELPMDRASRMERAREQGFDPTDVQLHGTSDDIVSFREGLLGERDPGYVGQGVYTTPEARLASSYANMAPPRERNIAGDYSSPNVMPLLTRGGEYQQFDLADKVNLANQIRQNPVVASDLTRELLDAGKAGAEVRDATGALVERSTFDPRNIRSVNAAFDPQYKGANILGGTAATAIGAGALMAPDQAQAAIEDVDIFDEEAPMNRRQRAQAQRERIAGDRKPLLSGAQTANLLAGLTGAAGVADIFGEYPEFPEGDVSVGEMLLEGERAPSLAENIGEGNYLSAGLQTLGIIPIVGIGARAASKAFRASDELSPKELEAFGKIFEESLQNKNVDLRQVVDQHPTVVEAQARIGRIPVTSEMKGYGTPDWVKNRVFQFKTEDGVEEVIGYTPAVSRLYDQSKRLAWEDDKLPYPGPRPKPEQKTAVIVVGPPASGKSSISNPIARKLDATIIDSDEAKKLLPEYQGGVGANAVHQESKIIAREMEDIAIGEGDNLVIPTVGESAGKIAARIDKLKGEGYNVQLVDVQVPAEEAAIRMFRRFYKTGRMIPTDYLNRVGNKPSATYDILRKEGKADGYTRIDNSVSIEEPKPVIEDTGRLLEGTEIRLRNGRRNGAANVRKPDVSRSSQRNNGVSSSEERGIGSL